MVRFLHISDSHIGPDPAFQTCGHNPLRELSELVRVINALPFPFDFVLHTGDVADESSEVSYKLAASVLANLKAPIHYVPGNHDCSVGMQRTLLASKEPLGRIDQFFAVGGVQFLLLDSRGAIQPGGELTQSQLEWLAAFCTADGPPLVIALHHPPITLDVPWLDSDTAMTVPMLLSNRGAFVDTIMPARSRLRGVFFGHVHRAFQVVESGILFSSAPSIVGQLKTWPELTEPVLAAEEAPGYCLVTIDEQRTIVQQYSFARAASARVASELQTCSTQ
ncbi:MAG: metallophosphoesterase [Gemmatimonadaceae bacterium]|nr:metallophosphoesterase [Gemmatimonadaceae bacterium]